MEYFSYTPCIGFQIHVTEEEARKKTESELEYAKLEAAAGWGWPIGTGAICYGKVTHRAIPLLDQSGDLVKLFDTDEDYQIKAVDDGE